MRIFFHIAVLVFLFFWPFYHIRDSIFSLNNALLLMHLIQVGIYALFALYIEMSKTSFRWRLTMFALILAAGNCMHFTAATIGSILDPRTLVFGTPIIVSVFCLIVLALENITRKSANIIRLMTCGLTMVFSLIAITDQKHLAYRFSKNKDIVLDAFGWLNMDKPLHVPTKRIISTHNENFSLQYFLPTGKASRFPEHRGGAMDQLSEKLYLVTAKGRFFQMDLKSPHSSSKELNIQIWEERLIDSFHFNPMAEIELRTHDLICIDKNDSLQFLVSHTKWDKSQQCLSNQISSIILAKDQLTSVEVRENDWEVILSTEPCLSGLIYTVHTGGKMILTSDSTVLVSVGDFHRNGISTPENYPQDNLAHYGKILEVNIRSKEVFVYSKGHRNPQGLFLDKTGIVWSTEHGPRGGDELNIIQQNGNYGWPVNTYGILYSGKSWPFSDPEIESILPVYSWVPSIGVSDVLKVESPRLEAWYGNLLAASMVDKSIYRLRVNNEKVIYSERVNMGYRVREILEPEEGQPSLIVWTDEQVLIMMDPVGNDGIDHTNILADCGTCHNLFQSKSPKTGPDLVGLYGTDIASSHYFPYSKALRDKKGKWTEKNLHAFLKNGQKFAPGNAMYFQNITDSLTRQKIVDFLKERR